MSSVKVILVLVALFQAFTAESQYPHKQSQPREIEGMILEIPRFWKNGIDENFFPAWDRFLSLTEKLKPEIRDLSMDSITYLDTRISIDTFISKYYTRAFSSEIMAELKDTSKTKYQGLEVWARTFRSDIKVRKRDGIRHYRIARMKYDQSNSETDYKYLDFIETKNGYRFSEVGIFGYYENQPDKAW
jgi:hypothetical protein